MSTLPAYTDDMTQTALYWAPGAADGFGQRAFDAPIEILCRWQNKSVMFRAADGSEHVSEAVVYPDRVLALGGYLALTSLADETVSAQPSDVSEAKEVRSVQASPDLEGTQQLNKVLL